MKAVNQLDEKLFILRDTFREHLLKHRKLMLDMSHYRFVDTCKGTEHKNIDDFFQAQEE